MSRDRHSRHKNWKKGGRDEQQNRNAKPVFRSSYAGISQEQIRSENEAIRVFKSENKFVCEICGQPVNEIAGSLVSKSGTGCVHFDCALREVEKAETLAPGDKVAYIGHGRFGVVNYPNVHDARHFTIKKIIEWEKPETEVEWRRRMSELFSQVH